MDEGVAFTPCPLSNAIGRDQLRLCVQGNESVEIANLRLALRILTRTFLFHLYVGPNFVKLKALAGKNSHRVIQQTFAAVSDANQ